MGSTFIPGSCSSVQFSPFISNMFACVSSQSRGNKDQGSLQIFDFVEKDISNPMKRFRVFYSANSRLLDVTWSEMSENVLWTGSSQGLVQIWDINAFQPPVDDLSDFEPLRDPIKTFKAHEKNVDSIEWSQIDNAFVLTSSSDRTVKMWDVFNETLVSQFNHQSRVTSSCWSPLFTSTFASTSADGALRVWSGKDSPDKPSLEVNCHSMQFLTCDWSRFDSNLLVTGSGNGLICGWDLRSLVGPVFVQKGHQKGVNRVKYSPHHRSVAGSVSDDYTTKIWDFDTIESTERLVRSYKNHSDRVFGLDFNPRTKGQIIDSGWDEIVSLFYVN